MIGIIDNISTLSVSWAIFQKRGKTIFQHNKNYILINEIILVQIFLQT